MRPKCRTCIYFDPNHRDYSPEGVCIKSPPEKHITQGNQVAVYFVPTRPDIVCGEWVNNEGLTFVEAVT
jgi:hypothetical protein